MNVAGFGNTARQQHAFCSQFEGLGYVALQAPELANPRMAALDSTEARATREALSLARNLRGCSLHLVGYSFGGHFAVSTRGASVMLRGLSSFKADPVTWC